ncbi:MAG: putative rane protein [Micavibrio sp.]|nr:putative rane protein [Micavibrio sp.]
MIFPLWAGFGLLAALTSAAMMLLQERLKVDGFALAFWCKIMCVVVTLPMVIIHGVPHDPVFYYALGASAVLYAISDVVFFRAIPKVGAAVVSRLIPLAVIFGFILWFMIDPALFMKYMRYPGVSGAILAVLLVWVWFATHLKKCTVSMGAIRQVWFVIFAATLGAPLAKITTNHAGIESGPYAYTCIQALMMMTLWAVYYAVKKPVAPEVLFSRHSCIGGAIIGTVSVASVLVAVLAYYHVDNPAYIPAVRYLDSTMILGFYALSGRKIEGNVWAGIGLVVCAAALIILKAQIH